MLHGVNKLVYKALLQLQLQLTSTRELLPVKGMHLAATNTADLIQFVLVWNHFQTSTCTEQDAYENGGTAAIMPKPPQLIDKSVP